MSRRFSGRELVLVLCPALVLGGFAWYRQRADQMAGSAVHGAFVSKFVVTPETQGYYQSLGYTHEITFTVDHPWPRPSWWGQQDNSRGTSHFGADPLLAGDAPIPNYPNMIIDPKNTVIFGGGLTAGATKKRIKVEPPSQTQSKFEDGHYIFQYRTNLSNLPLQRGDVTYHALYRIAAGPSFRISKVVRPHGRKMSVALNKSTGGTLQVTTKPFISFTNNPDVSCDVNFFISHPGSQSLSIHDYDYFITDGKGKKTRIENSAGRSISYGVGQVTQQSSSQSKYSIAVYLTPRCTSPEPLTLSGKISINENWPIPFSVQLPKR